MFRKIDHVELVPSDPETTIRFYTEILGFEIMSRFPVPAPPLKEVIYLKLGDSVLEIMAMEQPHGKPPAGSEIGYRAIALEVDDMQTAITFLVDKGVRIGREPVDLGDSWRAEILDPDGFCVELRQWKGKKQ